MMPKEGDTVASVLANVRSSRPNQVAARRVVHEVAKGRPIPTITWPRKAKARAVEGLGEKVPK